MGCCATSIHLLRWFRAFLDRSRSGLVPRKGRAAAPGSRITSSIAGAAAQPFRGTTPLLQRLRRRIESRHR
ncbi:hypothetical protein EI693_12595 [Pseudomonas oryziphila]|uniref:DUF1534 domain-containing protein n=1 Tax=Pseudomonas oryziphila TaxID=2894079 RepID=A0ABM7CQX3_9PSED|nr:hypothetical protein EI693_12595 [Pseudomonas oryziphila]